MRGFSKGPQFAPPQQDIVWSILLKTKYILVTKLKQSIINYKLSKKTKNDFLLLLVWRSCTDFECPPLVVLFWIDESSALRPLFPNFRENNPDEYAECVIWQSCCSLKWTFFSNAVHNNQLLTALKSNLSFAIWSPQKHTFTFCKVKNCIAKSSISYLMTTDLSQTRYYPHDTENFHKSSTRCNSYAVTFSD